MNTAYVTKGKLIDTRTIKLDEPIPLAGKAVKVVIEDDNTEKKSRKEMYGILKGKIKIADDFNAPLDCFADSH